MDNPLKGEVSFEAEGRKYTLVFSNNAWCALEAHLNRGIIDIYEEIGSWGPKMGPDGKPLPETKEAAEARVKGIRMGFCRAVFWAGLTDRHKGITIDRAGELMTAVGGLVGTMRLISGGAVLAQPTSEEGGRPSPPKRLRKRRGTGLAS